MNGRNAISGAVVLFVVACSSNVAAQAAGDDCASGACTPGAPLATGHVDPRFEATRVVLERFGPDSPYFGPEGLGDVRADGAGGLLRFRRRLDEAELAKLRRAGVEFLSRRGQVVSVGSIYGAFVRWEALDALRKHPLLEYAETSWHPRIEVPLEVTGPRIRATQHLGLGLPDHDGAGTVIGDLDSGIDVLHPHFFFADGGAFDWIDVDEDGALTPGVDAVDYNEDGEADGNETLRVLDGAWVDPRGETHNADGVLDVQLDWVYADQNRDEERNVGASAGFTELDPAYGEPLFIIDDADADGVVEPDEKLLLLKSSKVRRFVSTNETWERGTDLIDAAAVDFIDRTFHGTGVASILVGGQPRAHRRVGIAPGAEIVMYSSHMDAPGNGFDDAPQLADLQDAVQSGLDVVVHEWTNPYTAPHDGSGNFEAAMDEARTAGVVQVNPLGNMNLSEKHQIVEAVGGSTVELTFVVDDGWRQGNELLPYSAIYGSVFWRGEHLPTLALENPDGTTVTMPRDGTVVEVGEDFLQATHSRTSRGTHHVVVFLWNEDRETSVRKGDWTIHVTDTEVDDRFVGRIADYYSSWGVGVRWARPTFDEGTIVYPSTADAAFGVAAFGGRHRRSGADPGELRGFSGRGPRLDGARVVDIAAPDDPYAALSGAPRWLDAGYGRSWYTVFGGTSGAGPHVAGAVALLRAIEPELGSGAIEQRLLETARVDALTPPADQLPDAAWGAGKLDVFAAIHGRSARDVNQPPIAEAIAEAVDRDGTMELDASASNDPDGDALRFRWDFDYDGIWDTELSDDAVTTHRFEPGATVRVRLDVRDVEGGVAGMVHRFAVPTNGESDAGDVADTGGDVGPDVEFVPSSDPERPVCGCRSAAEGSVWSLVVVLWFLRPRRREKPDAQTLSR